MGATCIALVPAYNEEAGIAQTIESLLNQTRRPDLVVVVANNCTDRTVEIARTYPVQVVDMWRNPDKKAGAMNFAWEQYAAGHDFVFTMDADTELAPDAIEHLVADLEADRGLGAVCARYWAKPGEGLVWRLQRLEYARFDDTRDLRGWKVQVASGAAVMYRNEALRQVCRDLGRSTPWDGTSLIEDYALTLDLKTVGWRVAASSTAHVHTDTPATFSELWHQRLRWCRGGIDEVRKRGWTPATRRDIGAYGFFGFSTLMRVLFVVFLVLLLVNDGSWRFALVGLIPLAVMFLERVTSFMRLSGKSWRDWSVVVVVLVEDAYGLFLEACTFKAIYNSLRTRRQAW